MANISNPSKLLPTILTKTRIPLSTSSPVPTHEQIAHLILEQKSPTQALQTFRLATTNLPTFTPHQSTYGALVHKLCTFYRFDIVHQQLDEMPGSIGSPPDEDIFITIVRGLGPARIIRQVVKVLDLIAKFGKNPSLKLLNSILDILVKEDIDITRVFHRKKMMGCGVQGDCYTFGILMKGLCLTSRIGDSFKLLHVMKNGKVGRARSLMNDMVEPNEVIFNVMVVDILRKEGRAMKAVDVLARVGSKGGSLDPALDMFSEMKTAGIIWNIAMYDTLIHGFCSRGRMEYGFKILEQMEETVDRSLRILGLCKEGSIEEAKRVNDQMKVEGVVPCTLVYVSLINGYCQEGKVVGASKLFEDMVGRGCLPNLGSYSPLVDAFCAKGDFHKAFMFFLQMVEKGIVPDYHSWNSSKKCNSYTLSDLQESHRRFYYVDGGGTLMSAVEIYPMTPFFEICVLDAFVAPGSELWMFNEVPEKEKEKKLIDGGLDINCLVNITLVNREGNDVVRHHLECINLESFDSIIILADTIHQLLDEMPGSIGSAPDEDIFITIVRGLG
ncbi:hypothetical protein LguiA_002639 [Lonicera macranthoides]